MVGVNTGAVSSTVVPFGGVSPFLPVSEARKLISVRARLSRVDSDARDPSTVSRSVRHVPFSARGGIQS